jgi:hypothetical protein
LPFCKYVYFRQAAALESAGDDRKKLPILGLNCKEESRLLLLFFLIKKKLGVSRLVVKNIMLLLKGVSKAYCTEALKSDDRNALEDSRGSLVMAQIR